MIGEVGVSSNFSRKNELLNYINIYINISLFIVLSSFKLGYIIQSCPTKLTLALTYHPLRI